MSPSKAWAFLTCLQEDEWLAGLRARDPTAIWQKKWFPHNYEVTAFEAYLDMYSLTGNATYLDAVQGAWEMFVSSFLHVGGAMAINEGSDGTNTSAGLWCGHRTRRGRPVLNDHQPIMPLL